VPRIAELARTSDVTLSRSVCDGGPADPEVNEGWELVCVTGGAFRRETDEGVALVDSTTVYIGRPRQAHLIHHVDGHGDVGDLIAVSPAMIEDLADQLPSLPVRPPAAAVLAARALVAAAARGADATTLDELTSRALGLLVGDEPLAVRACSLAPRRRAVGRVLERLACEIDAGDPPASLVELANTAGYAPHHLSRVFRLVTGTTIGRHRRALRARAALARIEAGAEDLAAVAAEVGFADHSHLVRGVRAEFGTTPSGLRRLVRVAPN
jgi:AraC-like DNA-binding protein